MSKSRFGIIFLMMRILHFLFVALLLVIAIQADDQETIQLLNSAPKGQLLTPEEGCGISTVTNPKIVGGSPSKVGAWPWIVLLGYGIKSITLGCGGSLITTRHVLTAAHCISALLSFVRLAEHDIKNDTDSQHIDVRIARHEAHDDFDGFINDIAIIYLERDVEFTDSIRPICLPINEPTRSRNFVDKNPFVAGWGLLTESGKQSTVLMQVQVPVIDRQTCRKMYRKIGDDATAVQFGESVMCAGSGGKSTCTGDSGGPLMLPIAQRNGDFPYHQIGIVSYAEGCARKNLPTVYTNVPHYIDWIKERILK